MSSVGEVNGRLEVPEAVKALVDSHREIGEEPLHLAVYLMNPEKENELLLLEVLENFGQNQVSDDGEIMRVSFPSSTDLPIGPEKSLCLMLTNIPEFRVASKEEWASLKEVKKLIEDEQYRVVFSDDIGAELLGDMAK